MTLAGGILTLAGSNAYSGTTDLSGGTLALAGNSALPAGFVLAFSVTGGALSIGASASTAGMSFDNSATDAITGTIAGGA